MLCADGQTIRLVDGNTANQGRIEVLYGSTWGTMCDDNAGGTSGSGQEEARVACRQLGYEFVTKFRVQLINDLILEILRRSDG